MIALTLTALVLMACSGAPDEATLAPTATAPATAIAQPTDTPPMRATLSGDEPAAGATRIWEQDGSTMVYVPTGEFLMG